MQIADIENRFTYHPPTTLGIRPQAARYSEIRAEALRLALILNDFCPDSRELSFAVTHLEEMVFWANAAIARNEITA